MKIKITHDDGREEEFEGIIPDNIGDVHRDTLSLGDSWYNLKPIEKLPIKFEDAEYKIKVHKNNIFITSKIGNLIFCFHKDVSLSLLEEALDKWKEIKEKIKMNEKEKTIKHNLFKLNLLSKSDDRINIIVKEIAIDCYNRGYEKAKQKTTEEIIEHFKIIQGYCLSVEAKEYYEKIIKQLEEKYLKEE